MTRRGLLRLAVATAIACLAIASSAGRANAQGAEPNELKAAFVFQFANFVEWPEEAFSEPDEPFTICVVGNERVAQILRGAVAQRTVAGRPVQVLSDMPADEESKCRIVFFDKDEVDGLQEHVDALKELPVLTVSDADDFTRKGGVIRLYEERNRLRIEVNVDAAERAGLTISSKLLSLSRVVHDDS